MSKIQSTFSTLNLGRDSCNLEEFAAAKTGTAVDTAGNADETAAKAEEVKTDLSPTEDTAVVDGSAPTHDHGRQKPCSRPYKHEHSRPSWC